MKYLEMGSNLDSFGLPGVLNEAFSLFLRRPIEVSLMIQALTIAYANCL